MRQKLELSEVKQLKIFFLVAFGMPVLMGVLMSIGYYRGVDLTAFPNAQMFLPAAGVMIAGFLAGRKERALPKLFFIGFIILTVCMIIVALGSIIFPQWKWMELGNLVMIGGSIICLILLLVEKKEVRKEWGLSFFTNKKGLPLLFVLLFFVLYFLRIFLSGLFDGSASQITAMFTQPGTYWYLMLLVINFPLVFTAFFGEEYGWRYFLQPLLQKKYGLRGGILLLGVLWGIWHLPINLFYYSPDTWHMSILAQQITCISYSIFFGYAVMKTGNVWVAVIMHFLNNNLIPLFTGSADISNQVYKWSDIGLLFLINVIVFIPFLFAKAFRSAKRNSEDITLKDGGIE